MADIFLFNPEWEVFLEINAPVKITYKVNDQKISVITGHLKEFFQNGDQWLLALETGLMIPLPQIKSIVLSSRYTLSQLHALTKHD